MSNHALNKDDSIGIYLKNIPILLGNNVIPRVKRKSRCHLMITRDEDSIGWSDEPLVMNSIRFNEYRQWNLSKGASVAQRSDHSPFTYKVGSSILRFSERTFPI